MNKNAAAVIWLFPSRGSFVSNIPEHAPSPDNPLPVAEGTFLRCSDMLGVVLEDRVVEGIPVAATSVAVKCMFSLSRFPELDKTRINVWSMNTSQVLTGQLEAEAKRAPEEFLRKFMALEEKMQEQERQERAKRKKRPPGKRKPNE